MGVSVSRNSPEELPCRSAGNIHCKDAVVPRHKQQQSTVWVTLAGSSECQKECRRCFTRKHFLSEAARTFRLSPEDILFITVGSDTGPILEADHFQRGQLYVCHTRKTVPSELQFM